MALELKAKLLTATPEFCALDRGRLDDAIELDTTDTALLATGKAELETIDLLLEERTLDSELLNTVFRLLEAGARLAVTDKLAAEET